MPTPFTHLARAQQLLDENLLPAAQERFLRDHWNAFLLGSIAPDAHHRVQDKSFRRSTTHFYDYGPTIEPSAEVVMLTEFPDLRYSVLGPSDRAAFMAGYVGHLGMDVTWALQVVNRFFVADWLTRERRHFAFTTVVAMMDQRDYAHIPDDFHQHLRDIDPVEWLPFLPDTPLLEWRDMIAEQITPTGEPLTLEILSRTVYSGYDDLVDMLNSPQRLQSELWDYFPQHEIAAHEQAAFEHMQRAIIDYLQTTGE